MVALTKARMPMARALAVGVIVLASVAAAFGAPPKPPAGKGCQAWVDYFNKGALDPTRWTVANGAAPGYIAGYHRGYYDPAHVSLASGMLSMLLTQTTGTVDGNSAGVISRGAMIYTNFVCGYGMYEWTMRMSSTADSPPAYGEPVSGSVSAGFIYVNNSQTEIDFEFSGMDPDTLWLVNWLNPNPRQDPTEANETYTGIYPFDSTGVFHNYKFVWSKGKISYYIDGVKKADHTNNVPTAPAYFMINTWGTDSANWGGTATLDTPRYIYVSKAAYTPPAR